MPRPSLQSIDEFAQSDLEGAHVWCSERFAELAAGALDAPRTLELSDLPHDARCLIVIGGGTRIDRAKLWRRDERPELRLVAIPSLWGSGAEASPVVALNRDGRKEVELDQALLPDVRVSWPRLAETLPNPLARDACGDAWSHALEAFLSPLGSPELRAEIAVLMVEMLALPLGNDARWFEVSAAACAAQARAGVGLVHGIAHVIEGPLTAVAPAHPFGHARLCSLFLRPVLALNRELSPKFDDFTREAHVDGRALLAVMDELFERDAYDLTLGALEEHWRDVLRDPCTRTNSALVRPRHLEFFLERRFL